MGEWRSIIFGMPVPKGRARTARLKTGHTVTYTPEATRTWEESVILQAVQTRPEQLLDGPLVCQLIFWLPRPASRPKRELYPDRKPDLDNLTKAVLDALEGVIYTMDSRIVTKATHKRYTPGRPGVEIRIVEAAKYDPMSLMIGLSLDGMELQKGGRTG